ncbi:MAG: acyltransferase [Desulfobacteraceae bacterium]|nr:acyltransferase [Desulfobacteraceae bacterium]MBC2754849.1 acyltransferase [Desulfobacteraceae bacterium]
MANTLQLSTHDKVFLKNLRAIAIFLVVFGHVGGFWFAPPYGSFLLTIVPVFFFISGAVSFFSYNRSSTISKYIAKRLIGLLIPYYFACILVLIFFYIERLALPTDASSIIKWVTVTPTAEKMPFLFSQVWFLRVLIMVTIISPIFFTIHKGNNKNIPKVLLVISALSAIQHFTNIGRALNIIDGRFYLFMVDSVFFVFGFYYYTNKSLITNKLLIINLSILILSCIVFVKVFRVQASLSFHEYYPDLYYVLGAFASICIFLLGKNVILACQKLSFLRRIFDFLHLHTFSIFLLHGLGIYLVDKFFRCILPAQHNILYGLIMLFLTMLITCLISIPFTKLTLKCQSFLFQLIKI